MIAYFSAFNPGSKQPVCGVQGQSRVYGFDYNATNDGRLSVASLEADCEKTCNADKVSLDCEGNKSEVSNFIF